MTSMIDHDAPVPNRPRRDPYRGLQPSAVLPLDSGQPGQLAEPRAHEPDRVTVTGAHPFHVDELDDDGRAALALALSRRGLDVRFVAERFAVGRTRRGYVLGVTEYERTHPLSNELRMVLGHPVTRQHLIPVELDELPVQCRNVR